MIAGVWTSEANLQCSINLVAQTLDAQTIHAQYLLRGFSDAMSEMSGLDVGESECCL